MTNLTDIRSSAISAAGAGLTVYATKEDLPSSGLTAGDQAYVTANSRLYVSNGSGWYNVALINATPSLSIDPTGAIALSVTGETTTITLTATDSDNAVAGLTYSVDSDGSFGGLATISQDSSVFTITPLSEDSATTSESTLTFKASDGISFGSGTRTLTLNFKVQYSNYTTLLAKADASSTDNQVDASTNSYTITEYGNTTSIAFSPYHPGGYSNYITSSGSGYVEWTSPPTFSATAWCVETWFKPDGMPSVAVGNTTNWHIFGCWTANTNDKEFLVTGGSSGELRFYYSFDGSATAYVDTASGVFSNNTWVHLAVSFDGTNYTLYADGVNVARVANSTQIANTGSPLSFGKTIDGSGVTQTNVTGWYADGRVINGSTLESSNTFPVPTSRIDYSVANTQALMHHRPHARQTVTYYGDASIRRAGPYDYLGYAKADHGGSVYFDGNGDYMSIPHDNSLNLTGDFTIEWWQYHPSGQSTYAGIWAKRQNNYVDSFRIGMVNDTTLGFGAHVEDGTNVEPSGRQLTGLTPNAWNYIVFERIGNTLTGYLNGVQKCQDTSFGYSLSNTFNVLLGLNGSVYFTGHICDFRQTSSAVYNGSVTIPTAPLTAIANTDLLTCTNKNDIWDVSSGNILTKVGNTTASDTQRKFTTSSAMYFDGTGDYLNTNSNNLLALGTGDFTVECWVNKSDTNHRGIFQISPTSGGLDTNYTVTLGFAWGNSNAWQIYAGGGATNGSTFSLSTNTWYHAALVRSSGTTKLYIDGTEEISISDSQNYTGTYMAIGGYYNTTYVHNGYIQDLRVTKGLARYTTTFTPPTTEFDG
jgi:hypothetical protein